jgi:potassium efflux system protein
LLPDLRAHRRDLDDLRAKMSSAQVQLIDLREQRTQLPALENSVLQGLELQQGPAAEGETQDLAAQVRQLFRERRDLIEVLEAEYDVYSKKLGDLDSDQRALVTATEQFLGYIDERILWIRSGDWFGRRDLTRALEALLWLFHWDNWSQTVPTMTLTAQQHPLAATLVLAVIAILLIVRPQLQHILRTVGEEAEKKTSRRILPTMRAVWVTFLLAALVPLLVWYVGWLLVVPLRASEFCRGLGGALRVVAGVLLLCAFLRYAFIPGGLGSAHFGWNERSLKALRAAINRLLPWVLPLVLLTAARGLREEWQNSLGRLALTAMMGLVALAAFRVLRASGVIMQQARAQTPPGWVLRTRWIWLALGIGLPLALAALSMSGYHYTAVRLLGRLWSSAALIVALVFGRALALRWLLVSRRRYAMEQARQQREAREAAEAGATPQTEEDPADRAIRLATINEQTRQLVNVTSTLAVVAGLYVAWIDIFPALGILNTVVLWTKGQSVVTLANLGSMLLLLAITFVAARNLPGLLEITLLLRLSLKTGQRFAITTLARYVVIIIGMVVAFQQIGVSWSSVQWLAAAVTVGLGFGLQEIFANFVSGLILLFEQPVRVGDVVTVGGVEGTVSRIQMRATTITDWNRKELIVPNKEFVTGQIINWTLTDQILRIVIPVGVAYGSDTVLVRKTLLDVASRNPRVLTDPPYSAWFLGFGDSALQFELRAFVRDLENFLAARHELNEGIDQAFRKAGVEIAFPQQDLHIRSITGPLPVEREIAGQD